MSNPPPGKQSKKSSLLSPFKGLLSRHSRSPSHQGPHNASASISAASAHQVNPQLEGAEYTAILELSRNTAYEGLKMAIQGIYDCSGIFPPLLTAAGVLLTISKVVDVRGSMCSTCTYVINVSFCLSESLSK
jgi:hypothetical protein